MREGAFGQFAPALICFLEDFPGKKSSDTIHNPIKLSGYRAVVAHDPNIEKLLGELSLWCH